MKCQAPPPPPQLPSQQASDLQAPLPTTSASDLQVPATTFSTSLSTSLPSLSTFDLDSRTLPTITITPPYNLLTNSTPSLTTLEGERSTSRRRKGVATPVHLPLHLRHPPSPLAQLDGQEGEVTTCTTSTTTSSSSTPSSTPTSTSTCTSTPREAPTPLPRKCPCPCPAPHAPGALWNCAAPPPCLPP